MDTPPPAEPAPILTLVGRAVALGPLRRDLLPRYLRWFNDLAYTRATSQLGPLTAEALAAAFDRDSVDPRQVHFVIYEGATGRPIGGASLTDITGWTATFAIGIGEADCRGKGYGTEATRLVLDYGFNGLGLHNILLTVHGDNAQAIRAYTRAGFREIGRRREAIRRGGRLQDLVFMDCLANEFESPLLGRLLAPDA